MMRRLGRTLSVSFLAFFAWPRGAALADVSVPVQLQAQLVSKIGAFDRNFAARAGGNALVLVVEKPGDNDSIDVGTHFANALTNIHKVGGTSVQVDVLAFTTAASLAERCRAQRISLVYLSTS